ncbi:MAG TPA: cell envelope integrity protein CreD [Lentimicrobium sp.]|nr:cell envelope integrity protein CreD [Lentimicrobium sp.]
METNEKTIIENLNQFIRTSVTLKLLSIFILMLLLMIPMEFIKSLITERDQLRQTTINEVSNSWANRQNVYGPVLTIPFNKQIMEDGKIKVLSDEVHILPSSLTVDGKIEPSSLKRGIYKVVVYDSDLSFKGNFTGIKKYLAEMKDTEFLWDEAFLTINITDPRGIKDKIPVVWNGHEIAVEPGTQIPELISSGITIKDIFTDSTNQEIYNFSFDLHLQGSQYLGFIPLGKETIVNLTSTWKDPSFNGSFLPDTRNVDDKGFKANYKILELNRNYPQSWVGNQNTTSVLNSLFGVELLIPANDYQKSMRSAKYALLAIALTFLTFFLVEIFNKKKLHPFQYILIGLALCLFYTLLISISEHTNFDIAYIIASISVIGMIGLYAKSILKDLRQTIILVLILCLTYSFVYITLRLQDYALIIGSIGLSAILAFTMYITRRINWYDLGSFKRSGSED